MLRDGGYFKVNNFIKFCEKIKAFFILNYASPLFSRLFLTVKEMCNCVKSAPSCSETECKILMDICVKSLCIFLKRGKSYNYDMSKRSVCLSYSSSVKKT